MIDLECPFCGRAGSAPRDKAHGRLVCKKCHMVFHLGPTGRALPGEPPAPNEERGHRHGHGHGHEHGRSAAAVAEIGFDLSRIGEANRGLLGALAVLVVAAVGYLGYLVVGGGSAALLGPQAQRMADALADDDRGSAVARITSEGDGDPAAWYEAARQAIAPLKQVAAGHEIQVLPQVTQEDPDNGRGEVGFLVIPKKGPPRNTEISREAGAGSDRPIVVPTLWVYRGGRWYLDARQSLPLVSAR